MELPRPFLVKFCVAGDAVFVTAIDAPAGSHFLLAFHTKQSHLGGVDEARERLDEPFAPQISPHQGLIGMLVRIDLVWISDQVGMEVRLRRLIHTAKTRQVIYIS